MNLDIQFANEPQRHFYYATERNECFSGGFNDGKTFGGCLKALTLLVTFPKYRFIIARQVRADLMKTTYQTFFKVCPKEYVEAQNLQDGYTYLKNGSRIDWLHLDGVDESTLRGFEPNSILVDQSEECDEKTYDILDSRVGRWDEAVVPDGLLKKYPEWPKNDFNGKYIVPSYHLNLCNPDTQFHHLFRFYHPDSLDRKPDHFYIEAEWDPKLGSIESYKAALGRGEEWVDKYVKGKWGVSKAQVHRIWPDSLIDYNEELIARIKSKGNLYRVLDHGDASPTCCLWFAVYQGVYICYREYYTPGKVISEHRTAINDLSISESYGGSYADPQIFKKTAQKDGGFWSVADEYLDISLPGKPLSWIAADNNEFATRNRLNELLKPSDRYKHPVTGESPAPGIYFIKRESTEWPYGCSHAIKELGAQRRKLIGYYEGQALYSDDREESVADHAYDCIRYFVAMHGTGPRLEKPKVSKNSIAFYRMIMQRAKSSLPMAGSS